MFIELVELGRRIHKGHDALGYEKCSWDIIISNNGNYVGLLPCDVSLEVERLTSKKGKARLLLDKAEETICFEGSPDYKDKHETYIKKLNDYQDVSALSPVFAFYNKPQEVEKALNAFQAIPQSRQKGNMTFMVDSVRLVSLDCVIDAIKMKYDCRMSISGERLCSVCGSNKYPILDEPHGSVKMPKGQTSGSMLVSYNTKAFESYNLKGNINSGICTNCARNYVEALRHLTKFEWKIKEKTRKKYKKYENAIELSDDTLVTFWTKEPNEDIDPFSDICQPTKERVRNLFSSIVSGDMQRAHTDVDNYFYSCTLSSAAARIAVRDWMAISVCQYQKNIKQWFEDIETIKIDGMPYYPGINILLDNCIKKKAKPTQSDFKAKARIGTMLWHAAFANTSLPVIILQSVLDQIEHEKETKDNKTFSVEKTTIIRLVINRKNRNQKNKYQMKEKLDEQNSNPAYLCGRLFALVCQLQFNAQGAVNSSIKNRFFASASNTPGKVMGFLLTKYVPIYEKKTKGAYSKSITEIAARIGHFPDKFSTMERGEFALGYYYQYHARQSDKNTEQ